MYHAKEAVVMQSEAVQWLIFTKPRDNDQRV
jgi:hypothetical protein